MPSTMLRTLVLFAFTLPYGCATTAPEPAPKPELLVVVPEPSRVAINVRDWLALEPETDWDAVFAAEDAHADAYGELVRVKNEPFTPENWAATLDR